MYQRNLFFGKRDTLPDDFISFNLHPFPDKNSTNSEIFPSKR